MSLFHVGVAAISAIILFLFGIEHFSREIQKVAGEKFRRVLALSTQRPLGGFLVGAVVTGLIQSSTATSVICVGLVNAGVLPFKNALGIIIGANVGTTITAQLVAFKLTGLAPYLIILGFLISLSKGRISLWGKSIFYFGFVFFGLNLTGQALLPLKDDPMLLSLFQQSVNPFLGILYGALITGLLQSSSVTTGLAVILVQQKVISLGFGIPFILGANIGTTITAFIASARMDSGAKKTALAHFLFNFFGVLIVTPFIPLLLPKIIEMNFPEVQILAGTHLIFNLGNSLIFIFLTHKIEKICNHFYPQSVTIIPTIPQLIKDDAINVNQELNKIDTWMMQLFTLIKKSYTESTLALESKERLLFAEAQRILGALRFYRTDLQIFISELAKEVKNPEEGKIIIKKFSEIDYLYQLTDSLEDIVDLAAEVIQKRLPLSMETIVCIRDISNANLRLIDALIEVSSSSDHRKEVRHFNVEKKHFEETLQRAYKDLLQALGKGPGEELPDASIYARFLSFNVRVKDKITAFHLLHETQRAIAPVET